jgi:hypothetical protein
VLLDTTSDASDPAALQDETSPESQVADALLSRGVRLVAAEPEDVAVSTVPFFSNRGVPSVDNIDTPIGQIACAMALVAGSGSYGTRSTADRLLPDLTSPPAPVSAGG